ncbi:hypothetical protein SETIT_7G054600v2 [Setaria italica]|uniref:TF-B3 domain-containing protein n=1 Tax=Setaria italica TaxID=4555 RepID=A0A368RSH7_SETIT|nr:hypothetical protein SETIT_7G054600v2 [Setaria italica]
MELLDNRTAIVFGRSGKVYSIKLEMGWTGVFLAGGWSQFLKFHDITEANALLLRYEGNMVFTLKVYGPNGYQREFNHKKTEVDKYQHCQILKSSRKHHLLPFRSSKKQHLLPFRSSREHHLLPFRSSRKHRLLPFRSSREHHLLPFRSSMKHNLLPFRSSMTTICQAVMEKRNHKAPQHLGTKHHSRSRHHHR